MPLLRASCAPGWSVASPRSGLARTYCPRFMFHISTDKKGSQEADRAISPRSGAPSEGQEARTGRKLRKDHG